MSRFKKKLAKLNKVILVGILAVVALIVAFENCSQTSTISTLSISQNTQPIYPGAGKTTYTCPSGATVVNPTDDLNSIVNNSAQGTTFCLTGESRISQTLVPKQNQIFIGTSSNSRISGG